MDALRRFLWTPIGWLVFLLGEWLVVAGLLRWILPDDVVGWASFGVLIAVLIGLGAANLWLRRRFLPWDSPSDGSGSSG